MMRLFMQYLININKYSSRVRKRRWYEELSNMVNTIYIAV